MIRIIKKGFALRQLVAMPANSAAAGAAGQYAIDFDAGRLAIYVVGKGWVFATLFQIP